MTIDSICSLLAQIAPLRMAESWDNVGLLVGDRHAAAARVMTCLTISPDVVREAITEKVDLIVVHHPLPFKSMQRITTDSIPGEMLWQLIGARIAVYSAHTAFDSAASGINDMWAESLELESVGPLVLIGESGIPIAEGAGRVGKLPKPTQLGELVERAACSVGAESPRRVGDADQSVTKVALACGSGGSFLSAAKRKGCDAMITGEATFHTCLEAEALGIGLALLGHYWSERFAMERLAESLQSEFENLTVWASRQERDPIQG